MAADGIGRPDGRVLVIEAHPAAFTQLEEIVFGQDRLVDRRLVEACAAVGAIKGISQCGRMQAAERLREGRAGFDVGTDAELGEFDLRRPVGEHETRGFGLNNEIELSAVSAEHTAHADKARTLRTRQLDPAQGAQIIGAALQKVGDISQGTDRDQEHLIVFDECLPHHTHSVRRLTPTGETVFIQAADDLVVFAIVKPAADAAALQGADGHVVAAFCTADRIHAAAAEGAGGRMGDCRKSAKTLFFHVQKQHQRTDVVAVGADIGVKNHVPAFLRHSNSYPSGCGIPHFSTNMIP